jgi:hypothetical protein
MTTLTTLPLDGDDRLSLSLNPINTISDINPLIYGGFLESVVPKKIALHFRPKLTILRIHLGTWAAASTAASTTPRTPTQT